jgi:DNA polymerase IV
MDAFFASIEQREHPEYRGKPVIVGATQARGVVAAASYEAREFGIHSAMPGFRAHQLCPDGIYVGSNIKLYGKVSQQVRRVFDEFTPRVQPLSLDEAFLDISGSVELLGDPLELGKRLKRRVREETDLPISVGIAPNKMAAKIACTLSKPNGLLLVRPEHVTAMLRPLSVRKLWGVGPVAGNNLHALGLNTIADLADADPAWLREHLGERGLELRELALGNDRREVESGGAPKSIGEENTFGKDVSDANGNKSGERAIREAITSHAETVARRLRQVGYRARTVTIKAKLGRARGRRIARGARTPEASSGEPGAVEPRYPLLTRSKTLDSPTDDAIEMRDVAWQLWKHSGITESIRLVGVSASNLVSAADSAQLGLFDARPEPRVTKINPTPTAERAPSLRPKLGPTLDAIEAKFGQGIVRRAVDGPQKITHSAHIKRGDTDVDDAPDSADSAGYSETVYEPDPPSEFDRESEPENEPEFEPD